MRVACVCADVNAKLSKKKKKKESPPEEEPVVAPKPVAAARPPEPPVRVVVGSKKQSTLSFAPPPPPKAPAAPAPSKAVAPPPPKVVAPPPKVVAPPPSRPSSGKSAQHGGGKANVAKRHRHLIREEVFPRRGTVLKLARRAGAKRVSSDLAGPICDMFKENLQELIDAVLTVTDGGRRKMVTTGDVTMGIKSLRANGNQSFKLVYM